MKQICLACGRAGADRNLFCQENDCPAELSPIILGDGDYLGDIEIIKPVMTLRAAALYEAMHQERKVWLKVAHPGTDHKQRLKREAEFLAALQDGGKRPPATLPTLLPPYANTTIARDAYGKTMLQGHLLYFLVFEYFEGEPLRSVLVKSPQLWINHVGWLVIQLASALNTLHIHQRFHWGLSPESLLVRFERHPSVPRVLLYDLGIVADNRAVGEQWYAEYVLPAYTAPELNPDLDRLRGNYRSDVYGLGLLLYELLVGEPVFPFRLRGDSAVYQDVLRGRRVRMRRDDAEKVARIAMNATELDPDERPRGTVEMASELIKLFGDVPPPKKSRMPQRGTLIVLGGAFLIILGLIAVALTVA